VVKYVFPLPCGPWTPTINGVGWGLDLCWDN
jgi:hypothetical protein